MITSKQLLILAVVGLVALVPLALLAVLFFPPGFMYDHYSSYSYTTSISTNATVENATVLLPFPAGDDVGTDPTSDLWIYDGEGNQITDWDAAVIDTIHGPMLRLHTDQLVGPLRALDVRPQRVGDRPPGDRTGRDSRGHDQQGTRARTDDVFGLVAGDGRTRYRHPLSDRERVVHRTRRQRRHRRLPGPPGTRRTGVRISPA